MRMPTDVGRIMIGHACGTAVPADYAALIRPTVTDPFVRVEKPR
jgi:hypothetical protein